MNDHARDADNIEDGKTVSSPSSQPDSLIHQLCTFLRDYAVWWLSPIILILVVMAIVALLAGPARTPFIYR